MSRLKFSIYGNCQIGALGEILQCSAEFSLAYENVFVTAVHRISQSEEGRFAETIRNLDLFIHQPVAAAVYGSTRRLGTDHLLTRLKGSARAISFPSAYFTGYNPETIVWKDEDGNNVWDSFCNYHDLNILNAYYHGMSWRECLSYIQKSAVYTSELLEANLADSLGRLGERERRTNVTISAFIEENWRKERLFFGFNHCANSLLLHEANQILHLIGLPELDRAALAGRPEYMAENNDVLFVYPDVRNHFALSFAEEEIRVRGRTYTLEEAIKGYFDYYSTHPELVQHNIHRYQRSSDVTLSRIVSHWAMLRSRRAPAAEISGLASSFQEQDAQIGNLVLRLEEKNQIIENLQSKVDDFQSRLNHGRPSLDDLQREPDMIGPGTSVRVPSRLHPVIDRLVPPGTTRRYYGKLVSTGMRIIVTEGWGAFRSKARAWLRARRAVRDAAKSDVSKA